MAQLPPAADKHWLLKTVFSRKDKTIPAALFMSVTFVCTGLTPVVVGRAIDEAIATTSFDLLLRWIGILAVVFVVNALAGWFARSLFIRAMLEIGHEVREVLTHRIVDPRGIGGASAVPVSCCLLRRQMPSVSLMRCL